MNTIKDILACYGVLCIFTSLFVTVACIISRRKTDEEKDRDEDFE